LQHAIQAATVLISVTLKVNPGYIDEDVLPGPVFERARFCFSGKVMR